ncbi:uncharacterized protein LOC132714326, partial [Ruditapes philippinarum]|uniref:uncharacterized protein LOC132714326 n=1 Tax=Ruditapes philippinarum TaxID=129788 RepID=UPI00295A78CF
MSVIEILKDFLWSFTSKEREHLSEFVLNARNSNVIYMFIKENNGEKKGFWTITNDFCKSGLCQTILDRLCMKHENKSNTVVWNPNSNPTDLHNLIKKEKVRSNPQLASQKCSICPETGCPFELSRQGVSLIHDKQQHGNVDKFYWEIANMFMFRGNEKNNFPNTGPEDTDTALIFKLMKNCNLFSIDDNGIYDELLDVRNLLMHSADNRLTSEALDECFKRMESILKKEKFLNWYSRKAVEELKKLKDMKIIISKMSPEESTIVKEAFSKQREALKFDIEVADSLENKIYLGGILNASIRKEQSIR